MTLAVSTAAFDGHPLEAALDEVAALGLRGVEPAYIQGYTAFDEGSFSDAAAARLGRALAERGLAAPSLSAHLDLAAEGAEARLARRIGFAGRLGAGILITNAGPAAGRDAILRLVEAAVPSLEAAGVTLALENPGHGRGDLIGKGADGAALVAQIGAPRVRLNVDVGNFRTYAGALEPHLSAALPLAAHAHLKDVAEDGPHWRFVSLGEGVVDWPAVAAARARLAPGLPLAVELPLRLFRPFRGDPVRAPAAVPLPVIRDALRRSLAAWAGQGASSPGDRRGEAAGRDGDAAGEGPRRA